MLPTQANLATQTDILPIQNIGLLDQNQPQIYSLLANSNSPTSTKKPRRKKTTKLDETMPVVINPQITRTPTGVTFASSHHRSTTLPEPIPSFVSTRLINGHALPFRFCLEHNSYDANNNINNNQSPSHTIPFNSLLLAQVRQTPAWPNDSLPVVNTNSMPQLVTKSQPFSLNRLLNNHINERPVSVPSLQQNEYKHLNSSFTITDQGSLLSHSNSLSSPAASISASDVPPVKPKRKYSKRVHSSALVEQQQTSPCPTTFTEPTVSNGLPSIIPASVTTTLPKSEKHSLPIDIPMASNFAPLTPPASINSMKSPPTNIIHESSLKPVQQHLLPYNTTNIAETNSISKQYFSDQGYCHTQKPTPDSSANNFPYSLPRLLAVPHSQYCMVPSNLIPMAYSSSLSGTTTNTPSMAIPTGIKKERKKREKGAQKSKVMQKPTVEKLRDEQFLTSKSLTTDISATRKRKHKNLHTKDIRTKKQLRRIMRRNRLAILNFMMRKRKQQKQQPMSIPQLSEAKVEQVAPKLTSTHITKPDKMETNLPDIIAPGLKISFDATQKIESISLYYHRRRKPAITNESSSKSSNTADNGLGLLIEAVDFIETLHGSLKLESSSNK